MATPLPVCPRMLTSEREIRRAALRAIATRIGRWWSRARERRALAQLDERQLRDVGLTLADARRECAKPFWRE